MKKERMKILIKLMLICEVVGECHGGIYEEVSAGRGRGGIASGGKAP